MALTSNQIINWDLSVFYYHFYNKISANYEQQGFIIYKNLTGHAYSRGVAITAAYPILKGLNASLSYNFTDVQLVDTQNGKNIKQQQWYSPKHSALFSVSYFIKPISLKLDFTGSFTGAQRLPIQTNDYRKEYAPSYMLLNLLASKTFSNGLEVYAGVKNLLDYLPSNPLMRPFDPFNKTADDLSQNPNTFEKVKNLKALITQKHSAALIEIDGGVDLKNYKELVACGADVLVAGNTVFGSDKPADTIAALKKL